MNRETWLSALFLTLGGLLVLATGLDGVRSYNRLLTSEAILTESLTFPTQKISVQLMLATVFVGLGYFFRRAGSE